MKNLNDYIKSNNQGNEKYFKKYLPDLYNEIINYVNWENITFKQQLWHYQNKIQNKIKCKNIGCCKETKFKGPWTYGYYDYCGVRCSSQATNRIISEKSKEKKKLQNIEKEKIKQEKQKIIDFKKQVKNEKLNFYYNLSDDEYIELNNSVTNGVFARESWLKKFSPKLYQRILTYLDQSDDINKTINPSFYEKLWCFCNKTLVKPKCKCNNILEFKNMFIGYGESCSNACSAKNGKEKAAQTLFETKGVRHHSALESNILKRQQKRIDKILNVIGKEYFDSYDPKTTIWTFNCDKCNKKHSILDSVLGQRLYLGLNWRNCITNSTISNAEYDLRTWIQSVYKGTVLCNDRNVLYGKEIDIYLPDIKIGIEFNGLWYHSEFFKNKNYHYKKWELAQNNNINLIQIYEDDWKYKKEIIKSRLLHIFGIINKKIYARKCVIKKVEFNKIKQFLIENHLQGAVNSNINYALYSNDEIVAVMTFGKPRKSIGSNYKGYELYRYCNKKNTHIIGAASKLFKYFINDNQNINEVYSFSTLDWPGNVYYNIGMKLKTISKISFWWVDKGIRISRHQFNKHNLEKMGQTENGIKELGLFKVYGPGNKTFYWKRDII